MNRLVLPGLEAHNPLAFFAALGLLRVLADDARRRAAPAPRLAFEDAGMLVAAIETDLARDEVIAAVLRDAVAQADNRALQLAYDEDGKVVPPSTEDATRDLKPSQSADGARALLEAVVTADRRASDLAAAWFAEGAADRSGKTKPTAFHFTAGQQAFLDMVEKLRAELNAEHVREALFGPWTNTSQLPSLSWDSSAARMYALRATNPSGEKRGSVPGANWLAVNGLTFFPVAARGGQLTTRGVEGGWKDSTFTWPVWTPPADARTVGSLLRLDVASWTAAQRRVAGVTVVFQSRILRTDQGGYGSFSPAGPVPPRGRRPDGGRSKPAR